MRPQPTLSSARPNPSSPGQGGGLLEGVRRGFTWAALLVAPGVALSSWAKANEFDSGVNRLAHTTAASSALSHPGLSSKEREGLVTLQRIVSDTTLSVEAQVEKLVAIGLGSQQKSDAVRLEARQMLAHTATQSHEGALAVTALALREVQRPSLKFSELVSVAMAIDPEKLSGGQAGGGAGELAKAQSELLKLIDSKASSAKNIYLKLQGVARTAALDAVHSGNTLGAARVLTTIADMKVFNEGTSSDKRSLGMIEALIDSADICRYEPKVFELLIERVWPKIEALPRLATDKQVEHIQRVREKIVSSVHAQTWEGFPGIESEPWIEWWKGLNEDEQRAALRPPAPIGGEGALVVRPVALRGGSGSAGSSADYTPSYQSEEYYKGNGVSQEPPSVVFLIDGAERGVIGDGSRFCDAFRIAQAKCLEMVMGLPDGTKFTVIVNGMKPGRRGGEMEVFNNALVPANSESKSQFVRWMNNVRTLDSFEGIDMYQGFAEALELDPDRVVFLTVGMNFNAGRFGASGETEDIEVRHREGNQHAIDVMRSWDARLLVSALKPRLRNTTVDVGIVAHGPGTVEGALGLLGNVTKYPYRR